MSLAPDQDRNLLAAEYALGVLDGADRARAEMLIASDAAFAALVAEWQETLSPLIDDIDAVEPPAGLLPRIEASLPPLRTESAVIHRFERRINRWKAYSAAVSAVAASLLIVLGTGLFQRDTAVQPPPNQPALVANVAAQDRSAAFIVSYDPDDGTLLVSPAVATPAPGHDHQLWLIPASGTPRSLGLIASTSPHRIRVPVPVKAGFRPDATIAISVEPVGGSPTGQPTGPVVASGKLVRV
ncbi:anti-sigma factor [Allosphingosinicella flava]|uniref:Regulator of SigK n=1 Tax=Allosphingosinicella flava TaxID=2771430 RepID=A0A7T2LLT4_9SPHN|nr:anti-sigma factor [Sphingosinicella flava]QPQ54352.1 anti-sigma factor [Sphingosinicella flava]